LELERPRGRIWLREQAVVIVYVFADEPAVPGDRMMTGRYRWSDYSPAAYSLQGS
jgi:hypothetical protein